MTVFKIALVAACAAASSGIAQAEDLIEQLPAIWALEGPVLIELEIAREEGPARWAGVPMAKQVASLKAQLAAS